MIWSMTSSPSGKPPHCSAPHELPLSRASRYPSSQCLTAGGTSCQGWAGCAGCWPTGWVRVQCAHYSVMTAQLSPLLVWFSSLMVTFTITIGICCGFSFAVSSERLEHEIWKYHQHGTKDFSLRTEILWSITWNCKHSYSHFHLPSIINSWLTCKFFSCRQKWSVLEVDKASVVGVNHLHLALIQVSHLPNEWHKTVLITYDIFGDSDAYEHHWQPVLCKIGKSITDNFLKYFLSWPWLHQHQKMSHQNMQYFSLD